MIIVLTGASSFLGKAALDKLKMMGNEVISFRHSFEEEPQKLPKHADMWLHFAWAGKGSEGRSDKDIQAFNVQMSMSALKKAEELSCDRFLFAGSQAEYGKNGGSEYGRAKALFSQLAGDWLYEKHSAMLFVHMRIFSVYGPGDRRGTLIDQITSGEFEKLSLGPCTQLWNYLYIDDLCDAIKLLSSKDKPELINICSNMLSDKGQGRLNRTLNKNSSYGSSDMKHDSKENDKAQNVIELDIGGEETRPLSEFVLSAAKLSGCENRLSFGTRDNNAEGAADLIPDISRLKALGFIQKTDFETGIRNIIKKSVNDG